MENQHVTRTGQSTPASVHESVRAAYGDSARRILESEGGAGCCSGGGCCGDRGAAPAPPTDYPTDALGPLPADVAEVSWGCGDPVTLAGIQLGETVLDLGSGGGLDCLLAAERVGPAGKVIGVDMTPEMLSLAWRNAAKTGVTNVEFRYGHIEKLPVDSESVDLVISNCVINLSPDKLATFREVARVLKPGGRVSVSDIVLSGDLPDHLKDDPVLWAGCVAGALPEEEYLGSIREAGLVGVAVASRVPVDMHSYTEDSTAAALLQGRVVSVRVEAKKPEK